MPEQKYGVLLNGGIKLHRRYFKEMCRLLGINCLYYSPRADKTWTGHGEILSQYNEPELVPVIFDEHPTQQTMKKIGWVSELTETPPIIHVAYDLHDLQQGAMFAIPSGLDDGKARLFRVTKITSGVIYPASIVCQLSPEWENSFSNTSYDYTHSSYNLLNREEDNR